MILLFACAAPAAPPAPPSPPAAPVPEAVPETPKPAVEDPPVVPKETDMLSLLRPPPSGWVDLRKALPKACFHIGYHTPENFTGQPLPGYGAPGAWMLERPADALTRVQEGVEKAGYTLIVYDAYRPYRGTRAMVAWAERTNQVHLLDDGYIARRSGHNHGHTIDLGLADPVTCAPIDMGTPWDTLDVRSHTRNATGKILENRLLLKREMEAQGFHYYSKEWWHFGFPLDGTKGRDVPYGCHEPDEGAFVPPKDWTQADYEAPPLDRSPCPR